MQKLWLAALLIGAMEMSVSAAPITYLHHFSWDVDRGLGPDGGVALANGRLFGTTDSNASGGTIFSMNVDGSDYRMLHEFPLDGADGMGPIGKPIVVNNTVYGVTQSNYSGLPPGNIWAINTDGSDFRVLHDFGDGLHGANPLEGVRLIGDRLYGTTNAGGPAPHQGVLYSLNLDGSDYKVLHNFTDNEAGTQGRRPAAAPIQVGTRLYGTAGGGGPEAGGIVYSINPDGTDFQIVHSFPYAYFATAGVVAVGDRLYGGTTLGGSGTGGGGVYGNGTVYGVNIDGSDFELLHEFDGFDGSNASYDLVTDNTRLYGTTFTGFAYTLNLDGSGFEVLQIFNGGDDDDDITEPYSPNAFILDGSTLYGTTRGGGLYQGGTVFAITVPEPSTTALVACFVTGGMFLFRLSRFAKARSAS